MQKNHQQPLFGERAPRRSSVAWQLQQHTDTAAQRRRISLPGEHTTNRRNRGGVDGSGGGGIGGGARETGGWFGGGAVAMTGRTGGSEAEGSDEGDRKKIILILKRLEDHGRVSGTSRSLDILVII